MRLLGSGTRGFAQPEVQALVGGEGLRVGCECGGEGGIGLALVSYLHETVVARVRAARTVGTVGAATGGGRGARAAFAVGEGKEGLTRGL